MKQIVGVIFMALCLAACSRHESTGANKIVTIAPRPVSNTLYYSGTIAPYKTLVITCPADGVVVDMPFQYGDPVSMGQRLFLISSAKFLSDYKTSLMQYIKAKNDFNTNKALLTEGEFLHKNQLISDDDFKMKQSNYYGAQLGLLQARDNLESLLQQLKIKDIDLYKLTIADIDKITKALHLQANSQDLQILSPVNGIVLSPIKEDDSKKIVKGDSVKQGDVLAVLGDMNGLSVRIKVNELVVNQLKPGQKVKVTGMAFPDYALQGEVASVDHQGEGSNSGMPTFSVLIIVPNVSKAQQAEIHVGMSAKVEIDIEEEPQITVPIAAVKQKDGQSFVSVYDDKSKKAHDVLVGAGKTTISAVAILSGLKAGDKIVIPD